MEADAGLCLKGSIIEGPVTARVIKPLVVSTVRHLPDAGKAVTDALRQAGVPALPTPGHFLGPLVPAQQMEGPWALWCSPTEIKVLGVDDASAKVLKAELVNESLACVVDQSDASLIFELTGAHLDQFLSRLLDSHSIPVRAGHASIARLGEIRATLMRHTPDRLWLMIYRSHGQYLEGWLSFVSTNHESSAN